MIPTIAACTSSQFRGLVKVTRPRSARLRQLVCVDAKTFGTHRRHPAACRAAYSIGDLAELQSAAQATAARSGGPLAPLSDGLEAVLKVLQDGLHTLHVPYSYGYSIILLTLLVKTATYPLFKAQIESTLATQSLKPRIDNIKARYGDQKDKIQRETSRLYEQAGVNPLAGCLPSLATIPIFIGLYRSLTNVASEGLLDTEGFYWIPSLAGPTSIAARQSGAGTAWLFPFVDGHPPVGWHDAQAYCVLPVLLVVVQYISTSIVSPPIDPNAENANVQRAILTFLPLMIGWFALNVPSGLSLYYMSNTVLTSAIQIWLKKLGGAEVKVNDLGPVRQLGSARRLGHAIESPEVWTPPDLTTMYSFGAASMLPVAPESQDTAQQVLDEPKNGAPEPISATAADTFLTQKRCKRKKLQVSP